MNLLRESVKLVPMSSSTEYRRLSKKCPIEVGVTVVLAFQSSNILGVTSQYCCEGKREQIECWCTLGLFHTPHTLMQTTQPVHKKNILCTPLGHQRDILHCSDWERSIFNLQKSFSTVIIQSVGYFIVSQIVEM